MRTHLLLCIDKADKLSRTIFHRALLMGKVKA